MRKFSFSDEVKFGKLKGDERHDNYSLFTLNQNVQNKSHNHFINAVKQC